MGETWLRKLFETKKERNERKLNWSPCRCGSVVVPLWFRCGPNETKLLPEIELVSLPLCSQQYISAFRS